MGLIAIIPGIIALVLVFVGLSQASRNNSPKGLLIAGLIIAILATLISISQVYVAGKIAKSSGKWPGDIQNIINDVQNNVIKDLEDANVSIKVESDGDSLKITTSSGKKDKEQKLEELEKGNTPTNDTIPKKK